MATQTAAQPVNPTVYTAENATMVAMYFMNHWSTIFGEAKEVR